MTIFKFQLNRHLRGLIKIIDFRSPLFGLRSSLPTGILILFAFTLLLLSGCGANVPQKEKSKEARLEAYQSELRELNKKIAELEKELDNESPTNMVKVRLAELEPQTFEQFIEAAGIVHSDKNVLVSPETNGIITAIEVKEGQEVRKGQVLARLNVETITRSIQETQVNLQLATTLYHRRKNLWDQNIGSEVEFLQAKSNMEALTRRLEGLEAQLEMAVVKAPINGLVDDLIQNQGEMAGPMIPFARLVNLDEVYISAQIAETYLNKVNAGDSVWIEVPVLNMEERATIYRTSSVIDPDSRTFSVRVNLPNRDHKLQPNLMTRLKMRTLELPGALVVPSMMVKKDFDGNFIFVAGQNEKGQMVARKRYITTGPKDNTRIVATGGIKAGDRLITEGFAQVVDGSLLNVSP